MSSRINGMPPLQAGQKIRILSRGEIAKEGLLAQNPFGSQNPYFELGGVMAYRFEDQVFLMPNVKYEIEIEGLDQIFCVRPAKIKLYAFEVQFELADATPEQIKERAVEEFVHKFAKFSGSQFVFETTAKSIKDLHTVQVVCFQNPDFEG